MIKLLVYHIKTILIPFMCMFLIFGGCSKNNPVMVEVFESQEYNIEMKNWGDIATRNSSSTYFKWNNKPGMMVAYWFRNSTDKDLKIEFTVHIRGARKQGYLERFIYIDDAPYLTSAVGLLCERVTDNLDPIDIIESDILLAGEKGFGVSFVEASIQQKGESGFVFDWDIWSSIYYTVTIRAFTFESLSKGRLIFEYESNYIEIKLNKEL